MPLVNGHKKVYAKKRVAKRKIVGKSNYGNFQKVKGSGDYTRKGDTYRSMGRRIFENLGGLAGGAIGSSFGGPVGGMAGGVAGSTVGHLLGHGLGAAFSKITGNGDYVMHNSLMKGNNFRPQVSFGNGAITICHREYIQEVFSSTSFSNQTIAINPGLPNFAPFLSQLATNFDVWIPHGIIFEYRSTSSNALNSTNTALGAVIMAVQYNSLSPAFVSKQQMEAYEGAVSVQPSQNMICGVECKKGAVPLTELYVRSGAVPSGQDGRLYDLGDFNIATQGQQSANVDIAELWIAYHITLKFPKLNTDLGNSAPMEHWTAVSGISTSAFFGSSNGIAFSSYDQGLISSLTTSTLTFATTAPSGIYQLTYCCTGDSTSVVKPTITLGSGITVKNYLAKVGVNLYAQVGAANTSMVFNQMINFVQALSGTQTIVLSAGTLPANATSMDVVLQLMPNTFT